MKVFNIKCLALKAHVNMILHILTEYIFCIFMCVYLYIHIFMSMYIYTYMYVTTIDGKRHHNFKIMQAGIYEGHRMRKGKEKIMWLYYKLKTWF